MANVDTLPNLNIKEVWLLNGFISRKLNYFCHSKHHSDLEAIVVEAVIPGRIGRGKSA